MQPCHNINLQQFSFKIFNEDTSAFECKEVENLDFILIKYPLWRQSNSEGDFQHIAMGIIHIQ